MFISNNLREDSQLFWFNKMLYIISSKSYFQTKPSVLISTTCELLGVCPHWLWECNYSKFLRLYTHCWKQWKNDVLILWIHEVGKDQKPFRLDETIYDGWINKYTDICLRTYLIPPAVPGTHFERYLNILRGKASLHVVQSHNRKYGLCKRGLVS